MNNRNFAAQCRYTNMTGTRTRLIDLMSVACIVKGFIYFSIESFTITVSVELFLLGILFVLISDVYQNQRPLSVHLNRVLVGVCCILCSLFNMVSLCYIIVTITVPF